MAFGIGKLLKSLVGISSSKGGSPKPGIGAVIGAGAAPVKGGGGSPTSSAPQAAADLFSGFMDDLDQTFVRLGRGRDFRAGVTSKVNTLGVTLGS